MRGYRALLDCLTAEHFGVPGASKLISQGSDLDLEHWDECVKGLPAKERRWIEQAEQISRERTFFHWDVDFPDVFFTTRRPEELRRFDAVVGNPPWGGFVHLGSSWVIAEYYVARRENVSTASTFTAFSSNSNSTCPPRQRPTWVLSIPKRLVNSNVFQDFRRIGRHVTNFESFVGFTYATFEEAQMWTRVFSSLRPESPHPARVLSYEIRKE